MRSFQLLLLTLVVVTLTSGCQLTPSFTLGYEVSQEKLRTQPIAGTLTVVDLEDKRPELYYSSTWRIFLTYIPLVPYVPMSYERLDETIDGISAKIQKKGSGMTIAARQGAAPPLEETRYPTSFAKAIAKDLEASGLFQKVAYGDGASRYTLGGTLHETPLTNSTTSYLLGMPGVLLWLLPIPMGKGSAIVDLELTLRDNRSGEIVWRHKLNGKVSRMYNLYTSSAMIYGRAGAFSLNVPICPKNVGVDRRSLYGWHFGALQQGMQEAKASLASFLDGNAN